MNAPDSVLVQEYRRRGLVYYTPAEETLHVATHLAGVVAALVLFALMVVRARTTASLLTASLSSFLLGVQYAVSVAYHAAEDLERKRVWRTLDYPAVSLNVLACGSAFSLLYHRAYGYAAFAVCFVLVAVTLVLCLRRFDRFKRFAVVTAFVVGALMFGSFLSAYFSPTGVVRRYPVVWLHLAGLSSSLAGAALFGVKRRFAHAVFHVFVLVGPVLCMVGNLLQLT